MVMFKLRATLLKDIRVLTRDKVGLIFMFAMPVILAVVITVLQNSTFELVNDHQVPLLVCNRDSGESGKQLIAAVEKAGLFNLKQVVAGESQKQISERMRARDALLAVIIPESFSVNLSVKAQRVSNEALIDFGMVSDTQLITGGRPEPVTILYHPVLQESFRQSIKGALQSAQQLVETRLILRTIYLSINAKELPEKLEENMLNRPLTINEIPVTRDGSGKIPNATQHNIPAWTIFAMFFIVISLGSSVVREKLNGSFTRLKTLPTNYFLALLSKQITYLIVTLVQAAVIFGIGIWVFPSMGLPRLNMPGDLTGLFLVTLICGWCAVSFAICIGVFAHTQEQANGIGAVSIVLLAAIGGLLVPSFAMPDSFNTIIRLSPLHWCLEAYYGLFLEGGKLKDIIMNILPLFAIIIFLQLVALAGLKRKNLI